MDSPREQPFTRQDLESALEASQVGIWVWDMATGRASWTPQLERLFGFEVGGYDGSFETYRACIYPDDQPKMLGAIEQAAVTHADYLVEHRIIRRDDRRVRFVECRGSVQLGPDGKAARMIGTVIDVTPRREAEARLAESTEVTRLLNDFASDYVYSLDLSRPTLVPSIVAGSFQRVTSYTPEDLARRGGWLEVVHPEDRVRLEERVAQGVMNRPFVSEYRIVTADGEIRWLRDHARPVFESGRPVRLVGGVQDITERRRLEEQVLQSQKMEALARLAGGVAHDFNNLLTVIFGGVSLLQMSPRADRDADAVEAIVTSAERAAELTRALLALGRRQLTVARPMKLREALAAARPLLEKSSGALRLEVDSAADCTVRVDAGQLQLVLLNLVVNARDASKPGGVVRLATREVELSQASRERPPELAPGRYGAIDVIDEGAGIAPEVLPRIFEPFFTTKGPAKGTGLGLSITHGIVTQLGGAVAVKSRVEQGSTFTVYLPVADEGAQAPGDAAPARVHTGGSESVLVVEDEPRLRGLVARVLRDYGYQVREAGSAEEALALDDAALAPVALLLSDVHMPGLDGGALANALKARLPGLKVLLMSGYTAGEDVTADVTTGAVPFLAKPFTPDGLARRVREVLDSRLQSTQK